MSHVSPRRLLAVTAFAVAGAALTTWTAAAAPIHRHVTRGPVVTLGSTDLGQILIDGRGRTLYLYTSDGKNTSSCYGQCAALWPPLLTTGRARAAHGVKQSLLGAVKRKDGKSQVTYAGHPLYFFTEDTAPGDVNGQGLQNIWYAVSAAGAKVTTPAPAATIQLAQTGLGSVLVAPNGMTIYMFKPDTSSTSSCNGPCATNWPPLVLNGKLHAGAGLQSSLLGTIQRADGSTQVSYAGHPLYFYSKDTKAGDTIGQGVSTNWYVLSATGAQVGG